MNNTWITVMIVLGIVLFIDCIIVCKLIIRDYKKILRLTAPIYPVVNVTSAPQIYPVSIGTPVDTIDEGLEIIDV
tara:strand:+ start:1916 stop:2140 length:225 start_codon:yes stop_codon:yes gene_type:complete